MKTVKNENMKKVQKLCKCMWFPDTTQNFSTIRRYCLLDAGSGMLINQYLVCVSGLLVYLVGLCVTGVLV